MPKSYPHLSSPFTIGTTTIKNRFAVAPMDPGFDIAPDGSFTQMGIDYFVRRAQGGFGLIYTGGMGIDTDFEEFAPSVLDNPAAFVRTVQEINSRIAAYGTKMFVQLAFGLGRNTGLSAPSELAIMWDPSRKTRALTAEDIEAKMSNFVEAAKLVQQAGFAGIDVHAIHWGHLLDEFALSKMNQRTDEYGGSLENHLRIPWELRRRIAEACGPDFPVTIRLGLRTGIKALGQASYSLDEAEEAGRTLAEAVQIAKLLESYGYDGLSVDTGTLDSYYWACPPSYIERGYMVELAAAVHEAGVRIPVICGSRMNDVDIAQKAIADGKIDAIALGRPSIADPDLPRKVCMGLPEAVRPCIGCNQACIHRYGQIGIVNCAVNPLMGRPESYAPQRALTPRKVVVVGGGVAGMEVARTAAMRGHSVTLFEKDATLGGNLRTAGFHSFKREVAELNAWYQRELEQVGVDVRLGQEATPRAVAELGADFVVLAAGSVPVMPRSIPGIDHPLAMSCNEALTEAGHAKVGQRVVVVGGGLVGCEMALDYCRDGREVTIVEALPSILSAGPSVPSMNANYLRDGFAYHGAKVLTNTRLAAITNDGAVVEDAATGQRRTLAADTVVLSLGFRPAPSRVADYAAPGVEVFQIGDGRQVGNIMTAIWEAYEVARSL
ncbi:MAG: FAD-dependent oxidoreductase [Coriobacteriales bacterium]|nr:FAD-dependent oxidoreductase [Coriobacteriales bacterium]